jgi:prepilin-type N-terminal cleavage/methylation domain-containing protein
MKKTTKKTRAGFTMVEVLISLTILATLMAAVAFAFDASVTNFQVNRGIYQTVNTARQALLRITNDLRTAQQVALIGTDAENDPIDLSQLSFRNDIDGDGIFDESVDQNITYRFESASTPPCIWYDDNITGESYKLCNNVTTATFDRTPHQIQRANGIGGEDTITAVRDVRIVLTVTDKTGQISKTLAAATLVRKNQ